MDGPRRVGTRVLPVLVALGFTLAVPVVALAHGGTEPVVEVDPPQVTAGGTITIAGENMEPNSDRVVVLAGQQLIVEFGTVKTDADGMFTLRVTEPSHLPSGVYEIQAIGDETVSAELGVTAASGIPPSEPTGEEEVRPRHVGGIGLAVLIAVIGVLAAAGAWLVVSAERLAGHHDA